MLLFSYNARYLISSLYYAIHVPAVTLSVSR
jgi:hypothetical protein